MLTKNIFFSEIRVASIFKKREVLMCVLCIFSEAEQRKCETFQTKYLKSLNKLVVFVCFMAAISRTALYEELLDLLPLRFELSVVWSAKTT